MGGAIEIESSPGKGSRFWFVLGFERAAAPEPGEPRKPAGEIPRRVLVAEDNPVNQRIVKRLLEKLGSDVVVVANGAAAVEAVQRGDYDVVLMDCQMPEMDGLEATSRIRALPETNAIFRLSL